MKLLVVSLLVICSLVTAQFGDCPLPTESDILSALILLLNSNDGIQSNPNLTEPVHYTCQAQGSRRDTYRSVAIIATFTPNPGQPETTRIFQLRCGSGNTWDADTNGQLQAPISGISNITRTDCFQCTHAGGPGLDSDRCRGKLLDCCSVVCVSLLYFSL